MRPVTWLAVMVCLPLKILVVTSGFGYRIHPVTGKYAFHDGVDLRASHDTVYAVMDGVVVSAAYAPALGAYVRLDHHKVISIYGHLSEIFVAENDSVSAGQAIGITGATGLVTGEHLHFSVRYGQQFIDPLQFLYGLLIRNQNE